MKTVGSILQEARRVKGSTLQDVENAIKIRGKFLAALEDDAFHKLPSPAYTKGFIKNYSEYLKLDPDTVMAFYRRQTDDTGKSTVLPKGVTNPLNESWFHMTPGRFVTLLLVGLVLLFLGYLAVQYRTLQEPPALTIEEPVNGQSTSSRVEVVGSTDPDATVTINGLSVLVRSDGKFFEKVSLEPGENTITVIATSRKGKSTVQTSTVTYQP